MKPIRITLPFRGRDYRLDFCAVSPTGRSTWIIYRTMSLTGSPSATMGSATLPICSSSFQNTQPHLFLRESCLSEDSSLEELAPLGAPGKSMWHTSSC